MEILPQRDESGRVGGYVSIESEVSERRSREAELQNLRLAVEQSPTSSWTRQTRRLHEVDNQFVVTLEAALSFPPGGSSTAFGSNGLRDQVGEIV